MNKNIALAIVALFFLNSIYAGTSKQISTDVSQVKVFLDGAEIKRKATVKLQAGVNKLVFTDLSFKLIDKSIRLHAPGIEILSVHAEVNHLNIAGSVPRIRQLNDSLQYYTIESKDIWSQINAMYEEWNFIKANMAYVQESESGTLAPLKEGSKYIRDRNLSMNREINALQREKAKVDARQHAVQRHLNELNAKHSAKRKNILVEVKSTMAKSAELELQYVVSHASWEPSYDILVDDINQPIQLKYKARVFNNTDIDWKDVDMQLSTADPTRGATQPILSVWELNYRYGNGYRKSNNLQEVQINQAPRAEMKSIPGVFGNTMEDNAYEPQRDSIVVRTVALSELSSEFDIKSKYSIPSDAKPHNVDVNDHTLEADFQHTSVPKMEHAVFLLARITGWEKLNLVDGMASIYFGSTYVGESHINTSLVGDTLDISLGRDNKIQVNRKKLSDLGKKQTIGNNRKVSFTYEIVLKNNRNMDVVVEVLDQLPIPKEADITVDIDELSGAKRNEHDGTLTWRVPLKPGQTEKLELSFSIKFPKNKDVNIQKIRKYRTVKWM